MNKYFNILTTEGAAEATILLYGYIGETYDYYTGERKGVTDIDFVQELERLADKYSTIHVRINSPGGEIFHGSAIVTAIRNCKSEVNTWIDGVAASMAGIIWLAGKKRHMAKNGMLMLHAASGICWGNANDMRDMADTLEAFDSTLVTAAADATGMSEKEMKKKYFDGKDHWLPWNDVNAEGWLTSPDDYQAAPGVAPEDVTKLSYRDLVAWFERHEPANPQAPGFLRKVRAFFEDAAALFAGDHIQSPSPAGDPLPAVQNQPDMTLEEFKASIGDGTLSAADAQAFLDSQKTPPPAAPPAEPVAESAELTALKAQVQQLSEAIAAWGKTPGAGKSTPAVPGEDLPPAGGADILEARVQAAAKVYADAAKNNETAQFVIAD